MKDADLKLGTVAATGLDPKLSVPVFAVPEGAVDERRLIDRELIAVIDDRRSLSCAQCLHRIEVRDAPG